MFIVPIILFILSIIGYLIYKAYSVKVARRLAVRKHKKSFQEWEGVLLSTFPIYEDLSAIHQQRLLKRMAIFINEKFGKTKEINSDTLLCAAQACLPIINRKTNFYPSLTSDFEQYDQFEWFRQNFKQFEVEMGKMAAREFKDSFAQDSYLYFYHEEQLERKLSKSKLELLEVFYGENR